MDTRNGVTHRRLSREQATKPDASMGGMAQEAKAFGKAEGYADVGRVYGKAPVKEG